MQQGNGLAENALFVGLCNMLFCSPVHACRYCNESGRNWRAYLLCQDSPMTRCVYLMERKAKPFNQNVCDPNIVHSILLKAATLQVTSGFYVLAGVPSKPDWLVALVREMTFSSSP